MENEQERHITGAIGCPKTGGHAAFKVEDGKFICNCGEDFTEEVKELIAGLTASLIKIKS